MLEEIKKLNKKNFPKVSKVNELLINRALELSGYHVETAAKMLGVSARNLYRKIK